MWINTPSENLETQQTPQEAPKMPNDHPEKQWVFSGISDALRNLSKFLRFGEQNEDGEKKANKFQTFLASIIGIFNGVDIKKGVTIENPNDISKIREAFRPIIDLKETGIIFKEGDFIVFNEDMGTVDFYPADKTQASGHSTQMDHTVTVAPRRISVKTPNQIEAEYESGTNYHTIPRETNNSKGTAMSAQLGRWLSQRGAGATTGPDSCGEAVDVLLTEFGIKNVTPWHGRHGNRWHGFLKKDPRFQKIEVNSLSEIPPGAVLTFSGKWVLNGKANGSAMNQEYGHVEIKANNGLYYSFWHGTKNPGGSAREPQLHNNFAKWKEATGFTGAFVPLAKTKAEAERIKNSGESNNQTSQTTRESHNTNETNFINTQLETLRNKGLKPGQSAIIVSSQSQRTYLVKEDGTVLKIYICSTGTKWMGNQVGSNKTSTGTLKIYEKVGAGEPKLMSLWSKDPRQVVPLATKDTTNDLITSRILKLAGMDSANKNAMERGIFFHGTNEEFLLGQPASHGCIRMKNDDIIEMFDLVSKGTLVQIV